MLPGDDLFPRFEDWWPWVGRGRIADARRQERERIENALLQKCPTTHRGPDGEETPFGEPYLLINTTRLRRIIAGSAS